MFPVHWFLARRAVRAEARGAAIREPWLVQELTALTGLIAADPIDVRMVLERLAGIIRRIEGEDSDDRQ
jgi:hypothetical protein